MSPARKHASGEAHRPDKLVHALAFREDPEKPTFVVDVSDQIGRKLEAIACYGSQFAGALQAGEVYPGGRPLDEQIRAHAASTGSLIRARYGEPFWTRETLSVDTLGDLNELYRLATVAFVGGSLVPVGGHNLLEPATVGAPVLFGPHTDHVSEMAAAVGAAP